MPFDDVTEKQWKQTKLLTYILLVAAPLIYLVVTQFVDIPDREVGGETYLMFYILLLVAIIEPAFSPLVERFQLAAYRRGNIKTTPGALYQTVSIIKFALVEAIYIYGMMIFFMTGDINLVFYFYPIGMIWTLVVWPRRSKFEEFIEKAQLP
jgi:hypothetical protein